jgi:hypothetical protein
MTNAKAIKRPEIELHQTAFLKRRMTRARMTRETGLVIQLAAHQASDCALAISYSRLAKPVIAITIPDVSPFVTQRPADFAGSNIDPT